jgi:putative transposase
MNRTIKYQLDLNKTQKNKLSVIFGCTRFIYNYMLDRRLAAYKKDKTNLSWGPLSKEMTLLKREAGFKWLNDVPHESLQQSIRCMDSAFSKYFKGTCKFPKFKKRKSKQSCRFTTAKVDLGISKIRLPKVGWVRMFVDTPFYGNHKTVTVVKNSADKYFVSINYTTSDIIPDKPMPNCDSSVGIDLGIKHFAALSTGEKIDNPRFLEKGEHRLKVLQRRLAKKQKGSKRREAARGRLAKQYYKISCQRNDFLHKLSTRIIRENQSVIIEDLNVKGMMTNHNLAKAIGSVSWSEFTRQLEYKAEYAGKNLIRIGRFEPSSKTCSCCEVVNKDLKLSDREWTCFCGVTHDRDINAAINIKNMGLRKSGEAIPVEDVELPPIGGAKKRQGKNKLTTKTTIA